MPSHPSPLLVAHTPNPKSLPAQQQGNGDAPAPLPVPPGFEKGSLVIVFTDKAGRPSRPLKTSGNNSTEMIFNIGRISSNGPVAIGPLGPEFGVEWPHKLDRSNRPVYNHDNSQQLVSCNSNACGSQLY
jgi:hypothetical protein